MDRSSDRSVNIGITGLGHRTLSNHGILDQLLKMETVTVTTVCDLSAKNRDRAQDIIGDSDQEIPVAYENHGEMVGHQDLDAVVITTPWHLHIPMAITAMNAGVDCAMEVGPANSVNECHELVAVAERTGQKCMLLENYCFRKRDMTMINVAREGGVGELVHVRAGYHHDLRKRIAVGEVWRTHVDGSAGGGAISDHVKQGERTGIDDGAVGGTYNTAHQNRNGDMYPTHGLGPMAKCMDINRGNRFVSLTSTASKSRGVAEWADRNLEDDHPSADTNWRCGDVVTTVIKCANGQTILLQYDISLPDPVTDTVIRGTKGSYDRDTVEEDYYDEYLPSLWERYEESGVEPGHAGSDYLVLQSFVESVRRDVTPPIDVYDAAAFMSIAPLSERSIALGNDAVEVPDFTNGAWMTNERIFGVTGDTNESTLATDDIL